MRKKWIFLVAAILFVHVSYGQITNLLGTLVIALVTDAQTDDELFMHFLDKDSLNKEDLNILYNKLNKEISKDKENVQLYYKRALVKRKAGLYDEAIADFSITLEMAKKQGLSRELRDSIFFDRILTVALANPRSCIKQIDAYLEKHPGHKKALYYKGLIYYCFNPTKEGLAQSIDSFRELLQQDPSNSEARMFIGMSYIKLKEYDQAVLELTKAIELDATLASPYGLRAKAFYKLKRKSEACKDANEAAKREPELSRLQYKYCD